MTDKLKVDDFVWAKMKGYPQWPAKIVSPNYSVKAPKNKKCQYLYFFGSRNFSWIPEKDIILHSEDVMNTFKKNKSHALQNAIDDFMNHYIDSTEEVDYFKVRENPQTEQETSAGKKCNDVKNKSYTRSNESTSDDNNMDLDQFVMSSQKTESRFIKKHVSNESGENDLNSHIPMLQHSYHKPPDGCDNFTSSMSPIESKISSKDMTSYEKVISKKKCMSGDLIKGGSTDSLLKPCKPDGNNFSLSNTSRIEPVTKSLGSKRKKKIVKNKGIESDNIEVINVETVKDNSKFCELEVNENAIHNGLSYELLSDSLVRKNKMKNGKGSTKLRESLSISEKQVKILLNSNIPPRRNEEKHDTDGKTSTDVASVSSPSVPNFLDNADVGAFTDDCNLPGSWPISNDDSEKNIGCLGLDEVGQAIVKKFLEHKFHVTLLHKEVIDPSRYLGAKIVSTPAEMVAGCDIIYFFYTESELFKNVIFGKTGLLKGLKQAKILGQDPKGFVLITPPDLTTSHQAAEAIISRGGFYLEAPICGTIDEIKVSKAIIIASGDGKLYEDCKIYFSTIAKKSFFLSSEIGYSLKMSVVINMVNGGLCAVLFESNQIVNKSVNYENNVDKMEEYAAEMLSHVYNTKRLMNHLEQIKNPVSERIPFSLANTHRNMDLLSDLCHQMQIFTPLFDASHSAYKQIVQSAYPNDDLKCKISNTSG